MPPTSGCCRSAREHGFTLLELLVVLALLALLASLVTPALWRWSEAAKERTTLISLRARLEALPREAFFRGRGFTLPEAPLALPQGWHIEGHDPIVYYPNGMTPGGEITVRFGERAMALWRIEPPDGEVVERQQP